MKRARGSSPDKTIRYEGRLRVGGGGLLSSQQRDGSVIDTDSGAILTANKRIKLGLAALHVPLDRLGGGKLGASTSGLALPLPLPVFSVWSSCHTVPPPRAECVFFLPPFDPVRSGILSGFRCFLEKRHRQGDARGTQGGRGWEEWAQVHDSGMLLLLLLLLLRWSVMQPPVSARLFPSDTDFVLLHRSEIEQRQVANLLPSVSQESVRIRRSGRCSQDRR